MKPVRGFRPHGSGVRGFTLSRSSPLFEGPFGRIFRALPPADFGETDADSLAALAVLAAKMTADPDPAKDGPDAEESGIPAAYTYFGQFIDHDLTFDPASSLQRQNDPDALVDYRTPRFDLADPREEFYVTGLAWAQVAAAWVHAQGLLVQARAHLLAEQHADGAWATSANQPADDLQSTAHALQTLALTDREARGARAAERRAARWLLNGQAASGGWSDASGVELPLVDADIALGLMLAETEAGEDALPGAPFAAHQPASGRPAVRAAPQP